MPSEYNIYCDESCHLENDGEPFMVLGAIQCPKDRARYFAEEIRNIKIRHNLNSNLEIKWTKVSKSKVEFYTDLIKLFFASNELKFRGVIADKTVLQHSVFHQTHTEWYYKIYFNLLKILIKKPDNFNIFIDIRDTHGGKRIKTLDKVLKYDCHDQNSDTISKIQLVRSHEIELMQLADLIIGAISYKNRQCSGNEGKQIIIKTIETMSRTTLTESTPLRYSKINILNWKGEGH